MFRTFSMAALWQVAFAMSLGPVATQFHILSNEDMAMKGISPAPTPAPRKRDLDGLSKRQTEVSIGIETCGFAKLDWNSPVSCGVGTSCLFDSTLSWFGCCTDQNDCYDVQTWCVPKRSMSNTIASISTLTCNDGPSTECLTYLNVLVSYDITYTAYDCAVSAGTTNLYMDATNSPVSPITSMSSTTVPTPTPTPTTPAPSIPPIPVPSTKPIGAIVGGVIGGIAVLALIGFGIFFFMRRKRTTVSGPMPYDQPVYTAGQGYPAPTAVPGMAQYPNQTPTASQAVDTKGATQFVSPSSPSSPSSPTPPYQPPYSPTQNTVHAHEAHIAQLP